jgi:hypothetical protein
VQNLKISYKGTKNNTKDAMFCLLSYLNKRVDQEHNVEMSALGGTETY